MNQYLLRIRGCMEEESAATVLQSGLEEFALIDHTMVTWFEQTTEERVNTTIECEINAESFGDAVTFLERLFVSHGAAFVPMVWILTKMESPPSFGGAR